MAAASTEAALLTPADKSAKALEASRALADLRKQMLRFYRARARTMEALQGRRKMRATPAQASELLSRIRDPEQETKAFVGLRDLLRLIFERDPTAAELAAGVPPVDHEQLGVLPLLPIAAVAGGAITLSTLFSWLTAREETAQREMGMETTWPELLGRTSSYWAPVLLAAAVGVGTWVVWRELKGESLFSGFGSKQRSGRGTQQYRGPMTISRPPRPSPVQSATFAIAPQQTRNTDEDEDED